jgi:class 3 adenylate cyclase
MRESRKLATIIFADIAGYSALMQADEKKAMVILDFFNDILEKEMALLKGEIVQFFGDGCLLSFDSAVEALYAATSLQHSFIEQQIPVRIGMHLGDVLYKNNNAFGDGVNIASRVESLGVPGAVLLSKTVRDQVKNQSSITLTSLGLFHFKNITEKMEVFAVSTPKLIVPRREDMRGKLQTPPAPQASSLQRKEWERYQILEILDAIEEGKCILILGNYAFSRPMVGEAEIFLPEILRKEQQKLEGQLQPEGPIDFYSAAQAIMNRAGGQRRFMQIADIRQEELETKQQDRFRMLSEIPFELILSTYPFDLLHDTFQKNEIAHQYAYYSFLRETAEPEPFDMAKPLIYNLFGSKRHKESMVISLDRLYQFIFAVLGSRPLPRLIQDKVQQATQLVFLGFSFDDWYTKLLLRVLKVHEKSSSYAHPPGAGKMAGGERMFFESNFQITFLDRKIDSFISELYGHCEESGLLRPKSPEATSLYPALRKLVARYQLEEALEQLDDLMLDRPGGGPLVRELGDYYRQFHKIREWESYERFSPEELELKWKDLRNQLFGLIDRAEAQMPSTP